MGQCFTSLRHHLGRVRDRVSHWTSNSETLGAMRTRWRQRTQRQYESSRRLAELELELTTQREEITRLTGQLNDLDSQRHRLSTRATELENEVTTLRRLAEQRNHDWAITENEIQIKRDQELGRGAWGIVYRGEFHGCDVAVKEMHPIIISHQNRQLFEREVDIASRCRHPCLLQFIGATTGERPLLVTEIMECSLREQLPYKPREPRLSEQNIIIISLDVAKALNYLHQKRKPIIHHDISSSNVLLWRQGYYWRAKVSDYGTANFVRHSNINYAGALIYCAPESRDPDPQTPISLKVDVYSFGVLLCEMSIREEPSVEYRGRQIGQIRNHNCQSLVRRCVKKDSWERPDMDQVTKELQTLMSNTHQRQRPSLRRTAWDNPELQLN